MAYPANGYQPNYFPEAFTDGEMSLSASATGVVTGNYLTIYMSRLLALRPGRYAIKLVAIDSVTMWLGSARNAMRMILQSTGYGLRTFEFEVFDGDARIDFYSQQLQSGTSPCFITFSISRNGEVVYASNPTDWQWDFSLIADADLKGGVDRRLLMPVFTMLPNWKDGITENLEWLTDIMPSERQVEQRRSLRTLPRRTVEMGFLRERAQRAALKSFVMANGSAEFYVPLWFEQYRLTEDMTPAAGGVVIPDTAMREFMPNTLVLVIDKNPNVFDVAVIAQVVANSFSWVTPPARTWRKGSRVVPLRKARFVDQPSLADLTDSVVQAQLRFDLTEPSEGFDPSWGNCAPLFQLKHNWSENVTIGVSRETVTLDNGVSTPLVVDPSDQAIVVLRSTYLLRGRQQVNDFRRFLAMARGRAVRFYMQSFTNDILLAGDAAGPYMDVLPAGYEALAKSPQGAIKKIAIYFQDDAPTIYRDIVDVVQNIDKERIYIEPDLPPILARSVKRISYLYPVRFDQDLFEIQHDTDDSRVVRVGLVTRTVDPTNMPPIDCWVTSRPYPIEAGDALQVSTVIGAAAFQDGARPTDKIDVVMTIGDVQFGMVAYRTLPATMVESLASSMPTFMPGTIEGVGYRTYAIPVEALLTGMPSLQSPVLRIDLIRNAMAPESIEPTSITFMNGTLQ